MKVNSDAEILFSEEDYLEPENLWSHSVLIRIGVPAISLATAVHLVAAACYLMTETQLNPGYSPAGDSHLIQVLTGTALGFGFLQIAASFCTFINTENGWKIWSLSHVGIGSALMICSVLVFIWLSIGVSAVTLTFAYVLALDAVFSLLMSILLLLPRC